MKMKEKRRLRWEEVEPPGEHGESGVHPCSQWAHPFPRSGCPTGSAMATDTTHDLLVPGKMDKIKANRNITWAPPM